MKKYKSLFWFLGACTLIAAIILLINSSLGQLLPDYKNMPFYTEITLPSQMEGTQQTEPVQPEVSASQPDETAPSKPA